MFSQTRQIILKVTRGCNLACRYCYIHGKEDFSKEEMTDETFDMVMHRWMSETKHNQVELTFHGGEALRLGKQKLSRFINKAYAYANRYKKSIYISVQTNAVLLDREWISMLNALRVDISVSWDGYKIEDLRNGTNDLVFEKIKLITDMGNTPGVLMVAHKGNYKHVARSLDKLRSIGINSLLISRGVSTEDNANYALNADEWLAVFEQTLNYLIRHPDFTERAVTQLLDLYKEGIPSFKGRESYYPSCYTFYCGSLKSLAEIEPNGDLVFCSGYQTDKGFSLATSVFENDVFELGQIQKQWTALERRMEDRSVYHCAECTSQHLCDGGCASFPLIKDGASKIDNISHTFAKKLLVYLDSNRDKIEKYYEKRQCCN